MSDKEVLKIAEMTMRHRMQELTLLIGRGEERMRGELAKQLGNGLYYKVNKSHVDSYYEELESIEKALEILIEKKHAI